MQCPRCEARAEGRFCGFCGAALEARRCRACDHEMAAGHRYCSACGVEQGAAGAATARTGVEPGVRASGTPAPAAPAPPGGTPTLESAVPAEAILGEHAPADAREAYEAAPPSPSRRGWWITGGALAGAILFLSVPYVWTGWAEGGGGERVPMGQPAPGAASGPAAGPAPNIDLASMTPREAADRLFNRVMTSLGSGDQSEAEAFLPMAIDAYRLVPDLDHDGHFHLSLLQQASGDHRGGLETAERVLETDPNHLLALYAAAESARELGETDRAREHFRHALDVYDAEVARGLPEYQEHESFLPTVRSAAQDFLAMEGG